jgi:hypothetical protein
VTAPIAANVCAELALHALAHLPVAGPGAHHHARYLRWVRSHHPPAAWEPFASDAELLAALYARDSGRLGLHALPFLFDDPERLLSAAGRDLRELGPDDVDEPLALAVLRGVDPSLVDLVRTDMALAARAFAAGWAKDAPACREACARVAPMFERALAIVPELGGASVELAIALGPHGRVLGDRILAGLPHPSNAISPAGCAVLAMHEACVAHAASALPATAAAERYTRAEWTALRELARRLAGQEDELAFAHRRWLASLELDALAGHAVALGLVTPEVAGHITRDRPARAASFAS